ncbi:MAG TPA: hypothetical protein VEP66_00955 [Myxococcales bacterium]|nr:hypothetical protein [Myxococcales bacterium]
MAGRLTRFLNLERPHRPGDAPKHEVATTGRFTGEPPTMALERDFGDQPFLRCPRCEADNSRYAEKCQNCSAPLTGEDVRAWNEKLWAERKALEAQQQSAATGAKSAEALLLQNRMLGEALAQAVGARERARLSWWMGATQDSTPIGVRLLSFLPTTGARVLAGVLAFALFIGSVTTAIAARGHPKLQGVGFVAAMAVIVLFAPNVPRRRRW